MKHYSFPPMNETVLKCVGYSTRRSAVEDVEQIWVRGSWEKTIRDRGELYEKGSTNGIAGGWSAIRTLAAAASGGNSEFVNVEESLRFCDFLVAPLISDLVPVTRSWNLITFST